MFVCLFFASCLVCLHLLGTCSVFCLLNAGKGCTKCANGLVLVLKFGTDGPWPIICGKQLKRRLAYVGYKFWYVGSFGLEALYEGMWLIPCFFPSPVDIPTAHSTCNFCGVGVAFGWGTLLPNFFPPLCFSQCGAGIVSRACSVPAATDCGPSLPRSRALEAAIIWTPASPRHMGNY